MVQLDKEASFEKFKSLEIAVLEKQFQLEKISSNFETQKIASSQESSIFRERRIENVSKKIEINAPLQDDFETIYKEGGISRVQFCDEKINI